MNRSMTAGIATVFAVFSAIVWASDDKNSYESTYKKGQSHSVQLGSWPFFLVNDMDKGRLKKKLESCEGGAFKRTEFSIGHRGAPMQFPEYTLESYEAAAKMGAGIVECDVTFTQDKELVCRHSQCDLHTTTNILETELAGKCTEPFRPAVFDNDDNLITPASA